MNLWQGNYTHFIIVLTLTYWEEWEYKITGDITIMPSLSELRIGYCPKLKSLPDHFLYATSLQRLIINQCDILEERYRVESGDWGEWSKISFFYSSVTGCKEGYRPNYADCSWKATSNHIRRGQKKKAKSKRMSSSTLLIVFVVMPSVKKGMILPFSSTGNHSSRGHRGQTAIALGLTALMGVGQTIPMDDLAGGITGGYIEVDIRISGFPKKQETFLRIHSP